MRVLRRGARMVAGCCVLWLLMCACAHVVTAQHHGITSSFPWRRHAMPRVTQAPAADVTRKPIALRGGDGDGDGDVDSMTFEVLQV